MTIAELTARSYVPYSTQPAWAVVEAASGATFAGVRVENISFPLTISAIQNALFCCISEGHSPATLLLDEAQPYADLPYWKRQFSLSVRHTTNLNATRITPILQQPADFPSALKKLLASARVPFSNFSVAALLQTEQGSISGVNIEVDDWSKGLCAERVAFGKALSYGYSRFKSLNVCTAQGEYSSPCGACRQVILEHLPHGPVHVHQADGSQAVHFSSELLPYHFQSQILNKEQSSS